MELDINRSFLPWAVGGVMEQLDHAGTIRRELVQLSKAIASHISNLHKENIQKELAARERLREERAAEAKRKEEERAQRRELRRKREEERRREELKGYLTDRSPELTLF